MCSALVRQLFASLCIANLANAQAVTEWAVHSRTRPQPKVVDPGPSSLPTPAPADAIVLFDGTSLAKWSQKNGEAAKWAVRDGYFETGVDAGDLVSRDAFGDVELHVEFMTPPPKGSGQDRGNSGVYLMSKYEIQVLDSYQNETYPDGQAAAIYGQYPPLVNASRPPGVWQSYDIVFRGPRFDSSGGLTQPATMTVRHNGVLVQDNVTLTGPTAHYQRPPYTEHPNRLPLLLQDHGNPVRYRNIWLRELK
jgi:hypothetical protein